MLSWKLKKQKINKIYSTIFYIKNENQKSSNL